MTVAPPLVTLRTVDDLLGAREGRFFGEGFKRVHHSLTGIAIDDGTITATAGLELPGTWSRKGGTSQRPHLSTIDVMLLGAQLTGLYAAHAGRLGPGTPFTVRSCVIKAGRKPQEDDLDTFAVSGRLVDAPDGGTVNMECRIGLLTVRVEAAVGTGRPACDSWPGAGRYGSAAELPGVWNDAPFGVPHRDRAQLLTDVKVDTSASLARADLALSPGGEATMVDLFVSALQLAQVLLYSLDDVARADSNTLWMRRTVIRAADGTRPAGAGESRFEVSLSEPRLLESAQGTWRSADVLTTYAGQRLTCSVAHLLPA
ncbi:AvrD family protein [Streptomyces iconiensis]|uniref:AvrD family protein n=1 Tax=Streptomyces iconiensis TaxID=1384038 RepID=A0ABT6ZSI6_9ACTN|nr:AvrD family protein [Streptomyces iconiensis]MDJ1132033.1 AvrD family protein [Streptomyces iconiensis]